MGTMMFRDSTKHLVRSFLTFLFTLSLFCGCTKHDKGAETCVLRVLQNAQTISDLSALDQDSQLFFQAKDALKTSFVNEDVEKRILAALRLYGVKGWEILKTVREGEETYVVMFLRSDSKMMGEPVDQRPGWRKALFRVEDKEGRWVVADLDGIIKKYGDKAFYNSQQE